MISIKEKDSEETLITDKKQSKFLIIGITAVVAIIVILVGSLFLSEDTVAKTGISLANEPNLGPTIGKSFDENSDRITTSEQHAEIDLIDNSKVEGYLKIKVKNVSEANSQAQAVLRKSDGLIISVVEEAAYDERGAYAVINVKIPRDSHGATIEDIKKLGEVQSSHFSQIDMGPQIEMKESEIEQFKTSLSEAKAALAIEKNEANILALRGQIKEYEATIRVLEKENSMNVKNIDYASYSIQFNDNANEKNYKEDSFIGGLASGWESLLTSLGFVLVVVGALLPWAAAFGFIWLIVVLILKLKTKQQSN